MFPWYTSYECTKCIVAWYNYVKLLLERIFWLLVLKRLSTSYVCILINTNVIYLKLGCKNLGGVLLNVLVNKTAITCLIVLVVKELSVCVWMCVGTITFFYNFTSSPKNLACMLFSHGCHETEKVYCANRKLLVT